MAADEANMYAVIRGDKKSGLAVTLYGNEIMLAPDPNISIRGPANSQLKSASTDTRLSYKPSINTATQAVDGRYASVYQATIGQMRPTNPPDVLTEFPPQRTETCRGGGNFVVGGPGSGDTTYRHVCCPNVYRGGLMWPDKESVCSPRPSIQPDAFVNSLRKYPPRLSPDRSTEIVERLVNYTQAKNFGRSRSPSQQVSHNYYENPEMSAPKSPNKISRGCDAFSVYDESPTRESANQADPVPDAKRNFYFKSCDVRNIREASKAIRENMSTNATCGSSLNNQPMRFLRQPFPPNTRRSAPPPPEPTYPSMVHSEIQAAVTMVCREVETVPTVHASKQDIKFTRSNVEQAVQVEIAAPQNQTQSISSDLELPSSNTVVLAARASKSTEHIGNIYEKQHEKKEKLRNTFLEDVKFTAGINSSIANLRLHHLEVGQSDIIAKFNLNQYYNNRAYRRKVSKEKSQIKCFKTRNYEVFRAEISLFAEKDYILRPVRSWLNNLPLKSQDFLGRIVKREQILCYVVQRIKMIPTRTQLDKKKFRAEILDIVDDVPFDTGHGSRSIYLKKITESLITRLEYARLRYAPAERYKSRKRSNNKLIFNAATDLRRYIKPSEYEIKEFVRSELTNAIDKSQLDIDNYKAKDVEDELVDILSDITENVDLEKDREVIEEILFTLEEIGQILKFQALNFASLLLNNFRKKFWHTQRSQSTENCINNDNDDDSKNEHQLIIGSIRHNNTSTTSIEITTENKLCETFFNIQTSKNDYNVIENQRDITKTDLNNYVQLLSEKIDEWLNPIEIIIPQVRNPTFRRSIIKQLVDDIVDRQKYLKLISKIRVSENEEIEHLRYQIFRWVYKLLGQNNIFTLEKAPELLKVIKSVPVPEKLCLQHMPCKSYQTNNNRNIISMNPSVFTITTQQVPELAGMINSVAIGTERDQPDVVFNYSRQQNKDVPVLLAVQNSIGRIGPGPSTATPGTASSLAPPVSVSIAEMNKEFLDFVKHWVNSIPIPPETPQIQEIRQGFYQGIIQAISKIKSSPGIGIDPTFYEDALEEELDTLFSLLPQTDELLAKKPQLKAQLIIKNCSVNEKIKQSLAPDTFGQQIVKEISLYVPKSTTSEKEDDKVKLYEEVQMLLLAEEYIMLLRYREEDEMKANVYKNKLLRHIQEFVRELKQMHNAELIDIDDKLYMSTIAQAMQKVPLPSEETIKQEADEVMLGMEIDKWFADLPLVKNDELIEQIRRKRLRDKLVKKVYSMEKDNSIANETGEMALRHEVSLILDKLPLERDASLKINFMVDELTNRIKNRHEGGSTSDKRKNVGFTQFNGQVPSTRPENAGNQQISALAPQQTSPHLSGRWVNVPGTPIAVDEAQVMKDSSGKVWFSLESGHFIWPEGPLIEVPRNQTQPSLSLAGPAHVSTGPSPGQRSAGIIPQAILQPTIATQPPALPNPPNLSQPGQVYPPNVQPQIQMQPVPPVNINQSNKDEAHNSSLWLSKLIEDYETRHPPISPIDTSIQFGKPRHGVLHGLSGLETSQQPLSSSLNKSRIPAQPFQPTAIPSANTQQPIQGESLNESWLDKGIRNYEAKYPPLPPNDASVQFGRPTHGVIHDVSKFGSSLQNPPSSSLNQSKNAQNASRSATQGSPNYGSVSLPMPGSPNRGKARKSPREEKNKGSGWPYSLSHSVGESQQKSTEQGNSPNSSAGQQQKKQQSISGRRNKTINKQNIIRPHQSLNDPVYQSAATNPTFDQSLNDAVYRSAGAATHPSLNFPGQAAQIPEQQATGSLWLSKYINNYDAANPAAENNPRNSGVQPYNISIGQAPRNTSVMQTPEYSIFDQGRPNSSSLHRMEQTLVGPALDGSVAGRFPTNSQGVGVRPNIMPPVALGSSLGQSVHVQTPMVQQPIDTSVGLQAPGMRPVAQQPTSTATSIIQPRQDPRMREGYVQHSPITVPEMRPFSGLPPVIMDDSQNTSIPGLTGLPQFRKFPGPPPPPFDDSTEDSDGTCKCLEKIKKMRKKGLCRKCNIDMKRNMKCFPNPMRYYPPYPWYF